MIAPYFNDNNNFVLYHGDANTVLSELKEKVDVVFADPPYFLSSQKKIMQNGRVKVCDKGEWDRITSSDKINDFDCKYVYNLKKNGNTFVAKIRPLSDFVGL